MWRNLHRLIIVALATLQLALHSIPKADVVNSIWASDAVAECTYNIAKYQRDPAFHHGFYVIYNFIILVWLFLWLVFRTTLNDHTYSRKACGYVCLVKFKVSC